MHKSNSGSQSEWAEEGESEINARAMHNWVKVYGMQEI